MMIRQTTKITMVHLPSPATEQASQHVQPVATSLCCAVRYRALLKSMLIFLRAARSVVNFPNVNQKSYALHSSNRWTPYLQYIKIARRQGQGT